VTAMPPVGHHMYRRVTSFVVAAIVTFLASIMAFVCAMGMVIHWPISEPNMDYVWDYGRVWGAVGGMLVGVLAARASQNWRTLAWTIGLASALWATITGYCFFVHLARIASC
jgi:hypothetical protein